MAGRLVREGPVPLSPVLMAGIRMKRPVTSRLPLSFELSAGVHYIYLFAKDDYVFQGANKDYPAAMSGHLLCPALKPGLWFTFGEE